MSTVEEADRFAAAKVKAKDRRTKAEGVAAMIELAFDAKTPGIRAWAKQFLEQNFRLTVGVSDAIEGTAGSVSRQGH